MNKYAAGNKIYNGSSSHAHMGGGLDPLGYAERDMKHKARRNATVRRMKKHKNKEFAHQDWLGYAAYPAGLFTKKG